MKGKKILALCVPAALLLLSLSGCVPGDGANTAARPAGFWMGIWHGWIAPIALIWSLFDPAIGIYEVHNNGFWYNFGYYMAIISGFGGLALSRKRKKCGRDDYGAGRDA